MALESHTPVVAWTRHIYRPHDKQPSLLCIECTKGEHPTFTETRINVSIDGFSTFSSTREGINPWSKQCMASILKTVLDKVEATFLIDFNVDKVADTFASLVETQLK